MGWRQIVQPLLIITPSTGFTGLFVYSPVPGNGNLQDSITAQAGTDPYGNAFKQGMTNYLNDTAVQLFNGTASFFSGGTSAEPGSVGEASTLDHLVLESGQSAGHNQAALTLAGGLPFGSAFFSPISQVVVGNVTAETTDTLEVQGSAAVQLLDTITGGAAETWHTLTLGNGWSGTLRYRLRAENEISLDGRQLTAGTLTSGTIIGTLPAGYRPTSEVRLKCSVSPTPTAFADPQLLIESNGSVEVAELPASTTALSIEGRFPLD